MKLCDAPCATTVTAGPHRSFAVGEGIDGAAVDFPPANDVVVTYHPGVPTVALVGSGFMVAGALSLLTSAVLFLAPTEGAGVEAPTFVAGLAFGGAGVVSIAIGIPLGLAFAPRADVKPAVGPK